MNLEKAVALCRKLEPLFEARGFHIGLTGGCLYKDGDRKDVDLLCYPIVGSTLAPLLFDPLWGDRESLLHLAQKELGAKLAAHPDDVNEYCGSPVAIFSIASGERIDLFFFDWTKDSITQVQK